MRIAAFLGVAFLVLPGSTGESALIALKHATIDTRLVAPVSSGTLGRAASTSEALYLVQLDGPCRRDWMEALIAKGVVVVGAVPEHAQLVLATTEQVRVLQTLPFVSWVGDYQPGWRIGAALTNRVPTDGVLERVLVQVTGTSEQREVFRSSLAAFGGTVEQRRRYPAFDTLQVCLPQGRVAALAMTPTVIWIEPAPVFTLFGERACAIQAGAIGPDDACPGGPGYPRFLEEWGVDGAGVIVQVQDTGLDQGEGVGCHPDLCGVASGHFSATHDGNTGDAGGHGTINAGIIAGRAASGITDALGYAPGQGVAPGARIFNTRIFDDLNAFDTSFYTLSDLALVAHRHGAVISSNSWGCSGCDNTYIGSAQEIDFLVRDADLEREGNQPMCYVFSAGNSGPGVASVRPPGTAKNDITVGASENCDADGTDGCRLAPRWADNARDLAPFSSRGPTADQRLEPTLVSVGTHVQGPASTRPGFVGDSVCDKAWPPGQTLYARSSGTSHSAPMVAGAAALFVDWYRQRYAQTPSPALTKAALIDAADDMAGGWNGIGGTLEPAPNPEQGWGRPNLSRLFDPAIARIHWNETHLFTDSGQVFTLPLTVVDPSRPLTVTLVWTDAPGMLFAQRALVNNLDLELVGEEGTFLGNRLEQGRSVLGGGPDWLNNVERVVLPSPGTEYVVRVVAAELAGDGVPGNAYVLDQDFAIVVSNARIPASTGTIDLDRASYGCTSSLHVTVVDGDRRGEGVLPVTVHSTGSGDREVVLAAEQPPDSGRFRATLALSPGTPADDGILQVTDDDRFRAQYGDTGEVREATAIVDCRIPRISDVRVRHNDSGQPVVMWRTDEPADSVVEIGPCGEENPVRLRVAGLTVEHTVPLVGTEPLTTLRFALESTDATGNTARDDNSSLCHPFFSPGKVCAFTHSVDEGTTAWRAAFPWDVAVEDGNAFWRLGPMREDAKAPFSAALVTPVFSLGNLARAQLVFRQRHSLPWSGQAGLVEASTDEGKTWSTALHVTRGNDFRWHPVWVALQAFVGSSTVQLRFRAATAGARLSGTWDIDDLAVCESFGPSQTGVVLAERSRLQCEDTLHVTLHDADLADYPSALVHVESALTDDLEAVVLHAGAARMGTFTGSIPVRPGIPQVDGVLQVADGDMITLRYFDEQGSQGYPRTCAVNLSVTCQLPVIRDVTFSEVTFEQIRVHWETDRGTRGQVLVGLSCGTWQATAASVPDGTRHEVLVGGLEPDRNYALAIEAVDAAGNRTVDDNNGRCYDVRTAHRVTLYDEQQPHSLDGWEIVGRWGRTLERAYSGEASWTDSPYRIAYRGADDSLISPAVDLRGIARPMLAFQHAYNLAKGTHEGYVEVSRDNGLTWSAPLLTVRAVREEWHPALVNLTSLAGAWQARVRFRLYDTPVDPPGAEGVADGWYVDDIRLYADVVDDSTGSITLDRRFYGCASTVAVRLADTDLRGTGSAALAIGTAGAPLQELLLTEMPPGGAVFHGQLVLGQRLVVQHGDTLVARYETAEATAAIDCVPPVILSATTATLGRAAQVHVRVNEPSDITVRYGMTCGALAGSTTEPAVVSSATVPLIGLLPGTVYVYRVVAHDAAGNSAETICDTFVVPGPEGLRLSEVSFRLGAVELENPGETGVQMDGWQVAWTLGSEARGMFRFPSGFVLERRHWLGIWNRSQENDNRNLYRSGIPLDPYRPGSLALLDPQGLGVDFVRWNGAAAPPPAGTRWFEPEIPLGLPLRADLGRAPGAVDTDSGLDWFAVESNPGSPNEIATPTPTLSPTVSPTPAQGDTVVETILLSGNPLLPNARFEVALRLRNNPLDPIGTYWVEFLYDPTVVEVRAARDAGLGGSFLFQRHQRGGFNVLGVNSSSTLVNGELVRLTFETRDSVPDAYGIEARDFGRNDIYTVTFQRLPHVYDWRGTQFRAGTPTATPTGPTPTPSDTPTATRSPTATDTPDPFGARVETVLLAGEPCLPGATFEVGVQLLGNTIGRLGSYALSLSYEPEWLTFLSVRDGGGGMGVAPATNYTAGERARAFSAFNALSTLRNGTLFVATFRVESPPPGGYDMRLADFGPTGLVSTGFTVIPHRLEWANTRFCRRTPIHGVLRLY